MSLTSYFMEATYLVASILFVLALKGMSHPETARRGMFLAEGGMFAAIVGTLIGAHILGFIAVTTATINVVGGFGITDRMLKMFGKRKPEPKEAAK